MKSHFKIIIGQAIFLVLALIVIYILYPKANIEVLDNNVKFNSINANVILISDKPDFSNARYIDFSKEKNYSFNLSSGKYYWKSDNGIISGISHNFIINSSNNSDLEEIGDVKINISNKNGVMVGHIVLEPENLDNNTKGNGGND